MDAREQHVVAGRGLEHRPHWALLSQLLGGAGRGVRGCLVLPWRAQGGTPKSGLPGCLGGACHPGQGLREGCFVG